MTATQPALPRPARTARTARGARSSAWVAEVPGLAAEVATLESQMAPARAAFDEHAARVARPGRVGVFRATRHFLALKAGQVRWAARQAVALADNGSSLLRHPWDWTRQSAAEIVREQLTLLGPSAAELGRIIEESWGIAPGPLVETFRRHPVEVHPLLAPVAETVVREAFGGLVSLADRGPVMVTPVTQLHVAQLAEGETVLVRVLRPGIRKAILADARIVATSLAPFELVVSGLRAAHVTGVVELAARQGLEETDLRNEALNTIELGLALEDLELDPHIVLCRPVPGLVHETAVAYEAKDGAVPLLDASRRVDITRAVPTLMAVTLESALTRGVFHGDLRPEHLFVDPDGSLVIVGCGTLGRLDRAMREAALELIVALVSGDHAGQVAAMQKAGAVSDETDLEALEHDLAASNPLNPLAVLAGGEAAIVDTLRRSLTLMVRHRLRPPLELLLFARTVFSTRALLKRLAPELSLTQVLLPMFPRLAELGPRIAAS